VVHDSLFLHHSTPTSSTSMGLYFLGRMAGYVSDRPVYDVSHAGEFISLDLAWFRAMAISLYRWSLVSCGVVH